MNRALALLSLVFFLELGQAQEPKEPATGKSSSSISSEEISIPARNYYVRLSIISSRSGLKNNHRTTRTAGSDDSGGMSEGSVLPNLNYLTAKLLYSPKEGHQFSFGGLQTLDSVADRTVPTPFGQNLTFPGEIAALRYYYDFSSHFIGTLGQVYIDTLNFMDPTAGMQYRFHINPETSQRFVLSTSAPLSEKSHNDQLVTRTTIKAQTTYRSDEWTFIGGISHSRPFYQNEDLVLRAPVSARASGSAPVSKRSSKSANRSVGVSNLTSSIDDVDLIFQQKEANRTNARISASRTLGRHWKLNSGAGISWIQTGHGHSIWLTSARVIAVAYTFGEWEIGSDFTLNSDQRRFKKPTLPNLWNIGVHLTYALGSMPDPT